MRIFFSNIRQIEVSKNISRIFCLFNSDTRYLNFRAKDRQKMNIFGVKIEIFFLFEF